jgi:tetratricopeptide (TPR) repeat protein
LRSNLLTIEATRREAAAGAEATSTEIAGRLKAIEQTLDAQRRHEGSSMDNSNRLTLVAAVIFAVIGLLPMIFTSWLLVRALNRLATAPATFPLGYALGQPLPTPVVSTDTHSNNPNLIEQSSNRLLGVIERLEKRVHELEHASSLSLPIDQSERTSGSNTLPDEANNPSSETGSTPFHTDLTDRFSVILSKGQTLLSLGKTEEAIACFDQAIAIDSENAEALIKKGKALEGVKNFEEAIQCYDRAIAANPSMTIAYVYKGGICNQMERFNEALECYEKALLSQQEVARMG